ncbi:MAG: helix-turn-helix transcriptional regulator [Proteobacteria bacterium]|nr:helix-turn-helix transcriptional regulator [Pseudomonadota bacterium]
MESALSFLELLGRQQSIVGDVLAGPAATGGVDLAMHRAPAHLFERGASSDLLVVAQQNIASTSVKFDLGFGWREHFCASPAAVYVVPADADARWLLDDESQCVFLAFSQKDADDLLRQFDVPEPGRCLWELAGRGFDEALIHELVTRLWQEVMLVGPSPLLGSSCRVAVLHALARRFRSAAVARGRAQPKLDRVTLRRVLAAIHELPTPALSIEMLAKEAGLSPYHFSRLFRNSVGRSPYRYYDELRFQRAKDLLGTTDLPVNEIGSRLGFTHPSQFTRAFRRHAGCAPSAYRNQIGR